MGADAWLTISVVGFMMVLLVGTRIATDLVMVGALGILILAQVISPADALAGLGNPGLITIGILYVVVAGLIDTGAIQAIGARLLGRPKTLSSALLRVMLPVTAVSAFLNNTPVVAMFVPVIEDWAKRSRLSVSKLMMPLSFAAIFGGTCTLIGTSTNLIINGLVQTRTDLGPIGFFAIGAVGLPSAVVGILYVFIAQRWLLPERKPPLRETTTGREYTIEMLVEDASPMIGKNLEQAGLRNLPGAFLAEIERANMVLPAVAPTEILRAGDRLLFVGVVDSVVDLLRLRGLVPAPDQLFKLTAPRPERRLVEVVVSDSCPIVGRTIKQGRFRSRYDAVVIAVARNGQRLRGKIGDIEVHPGDTLMLETRPTFPIQHHNSRDFLLVSEVQDASFPRHNRAWIAGLILAGMVGLAASGILTMFEAALLAGGLMIATRCTTSSTARASIDWSVLTVIGAALGIGHALEASGAAMAISSAWLSVFSDQPWLTLLAIYVITSLFTEFIGHSAAAVIVFPIAQTAAASLDVSFWPFVFTLMMAASASFATPIGYQTNLMVYGPGGYHFTDYVRFGVPLNILLGIVTVALAPLIWPF